MYTFCNNLPNLAGAGKGNKGTSAQEVLAQGLRESNRKRAHQQLDRHAVQIQVSKSLVDLPMDARDSLLSSAPLPLCLR